MRVADAVVDVLERTGVEVVFGIPGVHNLALFDALWASSIRVVVTRHEGAAAHAADGYARATGLPGVVVTTTGPGAANALAGVGEAWSAGTPVLHLTTQVASADLSAGVQRGILHQSPGQMEGFRPLARWASSAVTADEAVSSVAAALGWAIGRQGATAPSRPGPAYVEIPFDVLDADADDATVGIGSDVVLDPGSYEDAVAIVAGARSPVVWAGGGVISSGAYEELARVAERLAAPVVTTYLGRTAISAEHPLAVAIAPHEPAVRKLLAEADALLAVGTDFGATVTMGGTLPLPDRIVRIDVDPDELAKGPAAVGIVADAREGLGQLDAALAGAGVDRSSLIPDVGARVSALRVEVLSGIANDPRTADAARFLVDLGAALPPEAIVACDMCVAGYWCGGYLPRYRPRTLLYPLGWGTLGFGLPAAIGAAASKRGPTVAVVGDGGFMYYAGELATARQEDLDLVVLVVNDGGYGMLRFDEERRYGRTFAADLLTPDLASLAAAFDVPYAEASLRDEGSVAYAVARGIEDGGVHLVELRAALYPPRTTSPRWNEPP